jgi:hypothetical protein
MSHPVGVSPCLRWSVRPEDGSPSYARDAGHGVSSPRTRHSGNPPQRESATGGNRDRSHGRRTRRPVRGFFFFSSPIIGNAAATAGRVYSGFLLLFRMALQVSILSRVSH